MKIKVLSIIAFVALLSGCATVKQADKSSFNNLQVAQPSQDLYQLNSDTYGYYLFSFFPIITGDPKDPDSCLFFEDQVNLENATDMLTKKANELGATSVTNVDSRVRWTGAFSLWIFWLKEAQVSADAVK